MPTEPIASVAGASMPMIVGSCPEVVLSTTVNDTVLLVPLVFSTETLYVPGVINDLFQSIFVSSFFKVVVGCL